MPQEEDSTSHSPHPAAEDRTRPFLCPRCDWLGTKDQVGDALACPMCSIRVNSLRQKGLDSLRTHYRLLSKMGNSFATTLEQKDAERARLERFFERLGTPL